MTQVQEVQSAMISLLNTTYGSYACMGGIFVLIDKSCKGCKTAASTLEEDIEL